MNGQKELAREKTWNEFIDAYIGVVHKYATGPVFVEMGRKWTDDLAGRMSKAGIREVTRWTTLYKSGSKMLPNHVWYGWVDGAGTPTAVDGIEGLTGKELVRTVLRHFARSGLIVLDPCTGLGTTARISEELGMNFRGNELNSDRMAKTEAMLRRMCK
jgi:hypothetical protein